MEIKSKVLFKWLEGELAFYDELYFPNISWLKFTERN